MKLKIKHLYFDDENWPNVIALLKEKLGNSFELGDSDAVLLTQDKDADFADCGLLSVLTEADDDSTTCEHVER